jgi:hypothetical protein
MVLAQLESYLHRSNLVSRFLSRPIEQKACFSRKAKCVYVNKGQSENCCPLSIQALDLRECAHLNLHRLNGGRGQKKADLVPACENARLSVAVVGSEKKELFPIERGRRSRVEWCVLILRLCTPLRKASHQKSGIVHRLDSGSTMPAREERVLSNYAYITRMCRAHTTAAQLGANNESERSRDNNSWGCRTFKSAPAQNFTRPSESGFKILARPSVGSKVVEQVSALEIPPHQRNFGKSARIPPSNFLGHCAPGKNLFKTRAPLDFSPLSGRIKTQKSVYLSVMPRTRRRILNALLTTPLCAI